ncbi:MAG TPA: UDP-N-acetylmuramate--L-alanine ligase [Candidatus Paceibacterota bacterium]|nr:UDP-N-acetylmuramate--L-alanine ligase [Candidatus Paceibacterota bacterium]
MNIFEKKHIHFVGAGGIGISALVKFFLSKGAEATCSDQKPGATLNDLEKHGATIFVGHDAKNIPENTDLVVYSSAVPKDNPELLFAESRNIPLLDYPQALGEVMKGYHGIAVSGTHGKTTTTSLLGKILERAGMDPLVVVGGKVPGWDGNLRLLEKTETEKIFVAEACEYRRNMLSLSPQMLVLTNIEADHLDYYRDLDDVMNAFETFIQKLPEDGTLVVNADDSNTVKAAKTGHARKLFYSLRDKTADLYAQDVHPAEQNGFLGQTFRLSWQGEDLGEFFLSLPGEFNVSNALAASLAALSLGAEKEAIRDALADFHGTWRRFEKIAERDGAVIYTDYAHHPTAVAKTLAGARSQYSDKKILAVFQPHQRDRTKNLFDDFVNAFGDADGVLFSEIYDVPGREENIQISSQDLAEAFRKKYQKPVWYAKDLSETQEKILALIPEYEVVLIMGAGDIYEMAMSLVPEPSEKVLEENLVKF